MHRSGKSQLPIELADGVTLDEVKSKTEADFRVALENTQIDVFFRPALCRASTSLGAALQ
jgi:hypothetical protein